ncbi:FAD-dependent monooxygenase [Streptomyces sp. NPDC054796]
MDADVVIVGAGPAGLMLAGELRLGGARVVVAEKLAHPTGQSRGLGFTARAMETFDQRGLLPRFGALETSPMGHFGGVQFDYTVLEGAHFGARGIPQSKTEAVLEDWATELGADIRRGWEFRSLTDHGDRVEVTALADGSEQRLTAAYVVGCDGGQSAVRKAAGIGFSGTPATRDMYLADIEGIDLAPRFLGERMPAGMVMAAPLGGGTHRIIVCPHDTAPRERGEAIAFAEVADAWRRITGEDISGATATWVSSFTDATRQATAYRAGRVLLAGDAAHIHLPAGGQGLSFGVQDSANLGWKLAAEIAGWAPARLLDTYHGERHPAGQRLLANTRVQGMSFLGGEEADPLRELLTELLAYDDVKRHLAGRVSHVDVRYEVGPGDHPLLGRRLPPRTLRTPAGAVTTAELLHAGQGVLLDLAGRPALTEAVAGWKDRVTAVSAEPEPGAGAGPLADTAALLVRPDGYVVWAERGTRRETGEGTGELTDALRRWFGSPGTYGA